MIKIKHVRAAKTISCKDAVTGRAKTANILKSKTAEYSIIDIHNVKNADISDSVCKSANTIQGGRKIASAVYVKTDRIRAHSARCRNGRDNLTLDELFCNMGGRK